MRSVRRAPLCCAAMSILRRHSVLAPGYPVGALLPVAHVLGRLMIFFSLAYVLPIVASLIFHDGVLIDFLLAMLVSLAVGAGLFVATRAHYRELRLRDGFLLVTLAWILMAGIGAMPLMIVYPDLGFAKAFFEAMSGMTTTGATVLVGLDHAPQSVNLWRHELQWLGGLGIIVLAVAILPLLGVGGAQLFKAESPGPMKDARLTERISDTARALWLVYVALTLACMVSLRAAGMSWFDSVCHAFSTLSLGGFSTRDASVGAWDSPAIEAVLIAFMALAGVNFATHYTAWRRRDPRRYATDPEAVAFLGVMAFASAGVALLIWARGLYPNYWAALRHAAFNVVSIGTTTGYMGHDYEKWPAIVGWGLLLLSGMAASTGSTGGGIKMMRTLILLQQARRELLRLLHPRTAAVIRLGAVVVPNKVVFSILAFVFLYFMTATIAALSLMATGLDFDSAVSGVIACINNTGPGLAQLGPTQNYAGLHDFQLWVLAATMMLGRLEVLSVLVVFTPGFWKR
jgi:trk system potassium uptake protein